MIRNLNRQAACDGTSRNEMLAIACAIAIGSSHVVCTVVAGEPVLRRPTAAALSNGWLFVANHRSGSVISIDTRTLALASEAAIAEGLSDIATVPGTNVILASDPAGHCLFVLDFDATSGKISESSTLKVSHTPVSIRVAPDASQCFVASLWARRVSAFTIQLPEEENAAVSLQHRKTLDLPFAPRCQLLLHDEQKLLVADSFGSQVAIIDTQSLTVDSIKQLTGSNIRGLTLSSSGRQLLVSHQFLNRLAHSTVDDIRWGLLMTSSISVIDLGQVLGPGDRLSGKSIRLGDFGQGAADPAGIVAVSADCIAIAISGTDEMLFHDKNLELRRQPVGRRPTALVHDRDNDRLFVTNRHSDSVTVLEASSGKLLSEIPFGQEAELSERDRGELLFFSSRPSQDGWMSCHSCHTDGHSNSLLADTLGDGAFGNAKTVSSLLSVSRSEPWAWNGRVKTLSQQVESSLKSTMHDATYADEKRDQLVAFLNSLSPPPSLAEARGLIDRDAYNRGKQVFSKRNCVSCHEAPRYTSAQIVEMPSPQEQRHVTLNPPSLLSVSQRNRYLHDGRATELRQVLSGQRHQLSQPLSEADLSDLLFFLQSI